MAQIRKASGEDTLGGIPESSSNLLERRRRGLCSRVLKSTPHCVFFCQNLLFALYDDDAAQVWESLPDAARALVPQSGRDFIYRWRTVLSEVCAQNGFDVSTLRSWI
jgi:hypothetical protein